MIVGMTRAEMRRELEDLRKLLGLSKPRTMDEWEMLPPTVRDPLAARAFIAEWGDKARFGPARFCAFEPTAAG